MMGLLPTFSSDILMRTFVGKTYASMAGLPNDKRNSNTNQIVIVNAPLFAFFSRILKLAAEPHRALVSPIP